MTQTNGITTSLLSRTSSLDQDSKLPPKSFIQPSVYKRIWIHFITVISASLLILVPIAIWDLPLKNLHPIVNGDPYCDAFYTSENEISHDPSTYLNINAAFGTLSYGTAKFIDLVWDLGFSRCGQVLIGWITYRVNTAALLQIMETQPVSYELFATLSLSWSSISSLRPVIGALFQNLGFRKKLILIWIVLNIFWVALWPTITNAMTGYIAQNDTFVKLKGEEHNYAIFTDVGSISNLAFQIFTTNYTSSWPWGPIFLSTGPNITLWNHLSETIQSRDPRDLKYYYEPIDVDDFSMSYEYRMELAYSVFYSYRNQTYDRTYFSDTFNIQCVATGVYQWGFSSMVSLFFLICNGLWVLGTYILWICVNQKSALCQKERRLGKYRAAIDLVESIYRDLGEDICAYSEKELEKELAGRNGVMYYVEERDGCGAYGEGDGDAMEHIGISSSRDRGSVWLKFGVPYG